MELETTMKKLNKHQAELQKEIKQFKESTTEQQERQKQQPLREGTSVSHGTPCGLTPTRRACDT